MHRSSQTLTRFWPFLAGPLAVAVLSLWLGQSTSWDLRNYHWYNAYALLHGRLAFDAAVAHHATYYNPLIDLPVWIIGHAAPAWGAALFLGLVQGLNFSFLYLLARDALSPAVRGRVFIAAGLAVLGVSGGYAVNLVGTTYYDNVVSVPVLAALWLIVRDRVKLDKGPWLAARRTALWAGALTGLAVGLKLPTAPFGIAMLIAIALAGSDGRRAARLVFWCGVAAFITMLLAAGWWMLILWRETGNPLFPYFNDVIGSSLILGDSYRDTRFLPKTWMDALLFPFLAARNWWVANDWDVTDWRIAFAYTAMPVAMLVAACRLTARDAIIHPRAMRILYGFFLAAYVSWLGIFAIYRYIAPLEMIAPLLIAAAIGLLPLPVMLRWAGLAAALTAMVWITPLNGAPRTPFTQKMIEVTPPTIDRPDATLALVTGTEPLGFVVPSFPARIAFLRVDGYLVGPGADTPLLARMMARIEAHLKAGGDLFTLYAPWEESRGDAALQTLGLARTQACQEVRSNLATPFRWCQVVAREPSP